MGTVCLLCGDSVDRGSTCERCGCDDVVTKEEYEDMQNRLSCLYITDRAINYVIMNRN